jgi:CRP/FNR family transcriptional regulator
MSSHSDLLRSIPYFSALSAEEIGRIERDLLEHSFAKGEVLFLENEPCLGLYIVKSGQIRIFKSSPEGREQVLLIARPGDTFNDVPVFDGGPNPASASALEPSTVYIVPKETLLSLVADCPAALTIIGVFAARLRHLTLLVENLSFRQVVSRLAKTLLELAVVEGGSSPMPRLTQDEMAAMVGSVRDVVGRALRTLEKSGAIQIQGQRILVVNPRKLKELV